MIERLRALGANQSRPGQNAEMARHGVVWNSEVQGDVAGW
jgi:hypothetical protein